MGLTWDIGGLSQTVRTLDVVERKAKVASRVGPGWVEEREEGWGLRRKEPQPALVSRSDLGAMCWHSLHLAWSEASRISERRERGKAKS